MATPADLDAEVAAAVIAQTSLTQRMISDYDDDTGEQIPHGVSRFRQRLDVIERITVGSNETSWLCGIDVDGLVSILDPTVTERVDMPAIWTDQQLLSDPSFWRGMASVFGVNGVESTQIVEQVERVGRILKYTATAQVILAP